MELGIQQEVMSQQDHYYFYNEDRGVVNVELKPLCFEAKITRDVYSSDMIEKIEEEFESQMTWLILNQLEKTTRQQIVEIELETFNIYMLPEFMLKNFHHKTKSLRIWCSRETFHILRKEVNNDISLCWSFDQNQSLMGVPIEIHKIPIDEIWLIDPAEWRIFSPNSTNDTYYDFKSKCHVYSRHLQVSKLYTNDPDTKLTRFRMIVETKHRIDKMQEMMNIMKISTPKLRPPQEPFGIINENDIDKVYNAVKKRAKRILHEVPQIFNPWHKK